MEIKKVYVLTDNLANIAKYRMPGFNGSRKASMRWLSERVAGELPGGGGLSGPAYIELSPEDSVVLTGQPYPVGLDLLVDGVWYTTPDPERAERLIYRFGAAALEPEAEGLGRTNESPVRAVLLASEDGLDAAELLAAGHVPGFNTRQIREGGSGTQNHPGFGGITRSTIRTIYEVRIADRLFESDIYFAVKKLMEAGPPPAPKLDKDSLAGLFGGKAKIL